jgi:hypothetical protein
MLRISRGVESNLLILQGGGATEISHLRTPEKFLILMDLGRHQPSFSLPLSPL